jgi:hypothetical protein
MASIAHAAALCALQSACNEEPRSIAAAAAIPTAAESVKAEAAAPSPPASQGGVAPDDGVSSLPVRAGRAVAYANDNPWDDGTVGPPDEIPRCEARLEEAHVTFQPASIPVHRDSASKILCGAPQLVTYVRGPGQIAYVPTPVLTCGMALALASYEGIVQEEAERVFHSPVVRVDQVGTYNCTVGPKGIVSEHSYANGLDVARFMLKNGKTVSVLGDFELGDGVSQHPAGDFLRAVSQRAEDEDVFSNVLTPFWDAEHKDHFHLDLARYRYEGARPAVR